MRFIVQAKKTGTFSYDGKLYLLSDKMFNGFDEVFHCFVIGSRYFIHNLLLICSMDFDTCNEKINAMFDPSGKKT